MRRPPTAVPRALAAERRRPAGIEGPAAAWMRSPRARPRSGSDRPSRAGWFRPGGGGHQFPGARPYWPATSAGPIRSAGRSNRAPSSSPAMPPDGRRRGGHRNRTKHTGGPPCRVLRGRLLVERQRREIQVECRGSQARLLAEDDAAGADAELGEVDPEDVGVLVVVGVQEKALVQRRYRAQGSKRELPAADKDLRAGDEPLLHIAERATERVPTTEVAPELRVMWNIGPDHLVWDAEDMPEHPRDFSPEPCLGAPRSIGEGHDTDPVVGGHRQLGAEAGHQPVVLDDEMTAYLAAEEGQADARQARIRLVVGGEHAGKRLRFEDRAVLAGATIQQRRQVASHIAGGRVDGSGSDCHDVTVADRVRAIASQGVPRREPWLDPLRSDEIRLRHAERLED